jgi:hypothetical protein
MERVDTRLTHRVARSAELVYAAIQGGMAYYISLRLDVIGHPMPRSILLLAAGVPVAAALVLAIVLCPGVRWAWWPSGWQARSGFAIIVPGEPVLAGRLYLR